MSRLWRAIELSECSWHEWHDGFVVFDELSASTHLLQPAAAAVFLTLAESGRHATADDLAMLLFGENPEKMSDNASFSLEPILAELEHIGLVESSVL